MQAISSDILYIGDGNILENHTLIVDKSGEIKEILTPKQSAKQNITVTHYPGALCPGFINTHCHIELSHLHEQIRPRLGIDGFIEALLPLQRKKITEQEVAQAIINMVKVGIVAVGDVSNTNHTFRIKEKLTQLHIHTFVEVFGLNPTQANERFLEGLTLYHELKSIHKSIIPHAPYSMSEPLLREVCQYALEENLILSYHTLESKGEKELFASQSGKLYERLVSWFGDLSFFQPHTSDPIEELLYHIYPDANLPKIDVPFLFVHNTFMDEKEVLRIKNSFTQPYMVLCPKANLYIENALPNLALLIEKEMNITLGTDSLASNDTLSIVAEMATLQTHYSNLTLEQMIPWATLNGAKALRIDHQYGSLSIGKKPGIVWLKNTHAQLNSETVVQRIV